MPPTIHCVRHAEGWHNLSEENMQTVHDASLTPMGRQQALKLCERFPNMDKIDMAVTSPLRRTIQTAFLAFNDHLESKKLPLLLLPQAQETSSKEADTGTELWKLQREFGQHRVDSAILEKEEGWKSNAGEYATDSASIHEKAKQVREWMKKQKCENLLLVTHGGVCVPCDSCSHFCLMINLFDKGRHERLDLLADVE